MSTESVGNAGKDIGAIESGGKSRLKVTVAIRNKKTGQWEKPQLNAEDEHSLKSAIETIRREGQKEKGGAWSAFEKDGEVIEVTKKGIYVKDSNKNWTDILSQEQLPDKQKQELKKTLSKAIAIVGDLSKNRQKTQRSAGEENVSGLKEDILIEVQVTHTGSIVEKHHTIETEFHESIEAINQKIHNPHQGTGFLKYKGLSDERIGEIQKSMQNLASTSQKVNDIMLQVKDRLIQGKNEEAIAYYVEYMPNAYRAYCDAMRQWQSEQKNLDRLLGEENPFKIDIHHPDFQLSVAKELFFYAERTAPKVKTAEALKLMNSTHASYDSFLKISEFTQTRITNLCNKQRMINQQIKKSLEKFNDPAFTSQTLPARGWTLKEIVDYKMQLESLKQQADQCLSILESTLHEVREGDIQKGMDFLSAQMQEHYSTYVQACEGLIILQKVARGRFLDQNVPEFSLNLSYPEEIRSVITQVFDEVKRSKILDKNFHRILNEAPWEDTLKLINEQANRLKEANSFKLARQINHFQERNLNFEKQIKAFVKIYQGNRELFEQVMREHGISDLQSALMFNQYEEVYNALSEWNKNFQTVVDLVNQKKDEQAIDAYADLINRKFPQFLAKLRPIQFSIEKLTDPQLEHAFKQFGILAGIGDSTQVTQMLRALNTERLGIDGYQELDFNALIKLAHEKEIIPGETLKEENLSENVRQAKHSISLARRNMEKEDPNRLFKQDLRFHQFFNFSNLQKSPLKKEWNKILRHYGWKQDEMIAFTDLGNRYAQLIQPLKEAEQAIRTEADPQKKRALETQLKVLADRLVPEAIKIHKEFEKLGGLKKMETLQAAAKEIAQQKTGASSTDLKAQLDALFEKEKGSNNFLGFESSEDLINRLEIYLDTPPSPLAEMLKYSFTEELALIRKIKFTELIESEAVFLKQRMADRIAYLDHTFTSLGLKTEWKIGTIEHRLLAGPQGKDPYFLKKLKDAGWSKAEIHHLSKWYDSYMLEYSELKQAKDSLDADPENPLLQAHYKKVVKQAIPSLGKQIKEFESKIRFSRLQQLESAIFDYNHRYLREYEKQKGILNTNLTENDRSYHEKRAKDIQTSIELLSYSFTDLLLKADAQIDQIERSSKESMSWDQDFLQDLTNKKSLLYQAKLNGEGLWEKLLKDHKTDHASINEVVKLYQKYQKALLKLVKLERKLEAFPSHRLFRKELLAEMRLQKNEIDGLEAQFREKVDALTKIQGALLDMRSHIKTPLVVIEKLEKEATNPEADLDEINERIQFQRELVGVLSNEELKAMIVTIDRLNLLQAFNAKRVEHTQLFARLQPYV